MHRISSSIYQDVERLGQFAMNFRGTRGDDERRAIANEYARIVERLIQSGSWQEVPSFEDQLPDDESVWIGPYRTNHQQITAAEAVAEFMTAENREGWEVIIPRRIASSEIVRDNIGDVLAKMGQGFEQKIGRGQIRWGEQINLIFVA